MTLSTLLGHKKIILPLILGPFTRSENKQDFKDAENILGDFWLVAIKNTLKKGI